MGSSNGNSEGSGFRPDVQSVIALCPEGYIEYDLYKLHRYMQRERTQTGTNNVTSTVTSPRRRCSTFSYRTFEACGL